MKFGETFCLKIVFTALFALTLLPGVSASALEDAPAIIHDNALLKAVYEKEAATGLWFAGEIRALLVAARRGKGPNSGGVSLRFRGGGAATVQPGDPESEMERQNRTVFEENPALREIYFHSPVAYLRMLKRLRQAAAGGATAAAQ